MSSLPRRRGTGMDGEFGITAKVRLADASEEGEAGDHQDTHLSTYGEEHTRVPVATLRALERSIAMRRDLRRHGPKGTPVGRSGYLHHVWAR